MTSKNSTQTLGDLAQRLYDKFAATQELLEPKLVRVQPTRWDELPEWRQEVWVTVAAEAVKAGAEIQKEIAAKEAAESHAAAKAFIDARRSHWNEFSAQRRCEGRVHCYASSQRTGRCLLVIGHEGECQ